jgi:hypothetical protein
MSKMFWLICLAVIAGPLFAAESPLNLMLQGRYGEAKSILDATNASPRYQLLYYALTEAEAARACSLYQVIAIRYPETDCDSVARARIDRARDMGFVIVPIAEWSMADPAVRPLTIRKIASALPPSPTPVPQPTAPVATAPVAVAAPPVQSIPPPQAPLLKPIPEPVPVKAPVVVPPPAPAKTEVPASKPEPESGAVTDTSETAPVTKSVVQPEPTPAKIVNPEPAPVTKSEPVPSPPPVKVEPKPIAANVPTPAPTAPAAAPASTGHWFVQVGAFANFDNAHKLALSIEKAGYSIKLVPRETSTSKLLQVRIGGYPTRAACAPVAAELKQKFNVPAVIVAE